MFKYGRRTDSAERAFVSVLGVGALYGSAVLPAAGNACNDETVVNILYVKRLLNERRMNLLKKRLLNVKRLYPLCKETDEPETTSFM